MYMVNTEIMEQEESFGVYKAVPEEQRRFQHSAVAFEGGIFQFRCPAWLLDLDGCSEKDGSR